MSSNEKQYLLVNRPRPSAPTPDQNPPLPAKDYQSFDETNINLKKKEKCVIL